MLDHARQSDSRGARRLLNTLIVLVVAMIVYGSWLPFRFHAVDISWATGLQWPHALHFGVTGFSDAVVNVIIYVPLALFASMRLMVSRRCVFYRWVLVLGLALGVSMLSEFGQLGIETRVASLTDMTLNMVGCLIGLCLAPGVYFIAIRVLSRLKLGLACRPANTIFWVVVSLVVLAKLVPFDFTLRPSDFMQSVGSARWSPFVPPAVPSTHLQEDLVEIAGSFFAFVLLGIFGAKGLEELGETRSTRVSYNIARLALLAMGVELLQLVIVSHTCDAADAFTHLCGAVVGSILGATLADPLWKRGPDRSHNPAGRMLLVAAFFVQITLIAGYAFPAQGEWTAPTRDTIQWIPFYAQFQMPFSVAVGGMISSLMWYLTLACLAGIMIPRRSWRHTFIMSALITVGVVVVTESLQACNTHRFADITEPLLALAAACVSTVSLYWLEQQRLQETIPLVNRY